MTTPARASRQISGLDGLRAVSVLLVLMHHSYRAIPGTERLPSVVFHIVGNGHLGVSVFFVLSGFLITRLMMLERHETGQIRLGAFYERRALRIVPAFACYVLVILGLSLSGVIDVAGPNILAGATYTWNYSKLLWPDLPMDQSWWYLGHLWSLALEFQFYLVWPVILILAGPRRAAWAAVTYLALAPTLRVVHYFAFPALRGSLGMMLHTAADPILAGALLALLYDAPGIQRFRRACNSRWVASSCLAFITIVAPVLTMIFGGQFAVTVGLSLESLAIVCLLVWVVQNHATTAIGRFLTWRPVEHVGHVSYGLYLWQPLVLAPSLLNPFPTSVPFPWSWAACLGFAEVSFWLVERPFNALRSRLRSAPLLPADGTPGSSDGQGSYYRPMSTLLVAAGLVPAEGGIQAYSKLIWEAFGRNGRRSLISLGAIDPADRAAAQSVVASSKWRLAAGVLSQRWQADIGIFTHVRLAKVLPLLKRRPHQIVVFLNGVEAWQPLGWFTRRALRRVSLFLSISQYTWERFCTANPEFASRPHAVLHLGIGQAGIPDPSPPEQPALALIIGRMARGENYKGHRQLIAAWPSIRQRVPGARLGIAGSGDLRAELEMLARQTGVTEAITFFGRVSEDEKQDLLRRARCFVMPSCGEGFGLVYLEAMRLGRPCLVGDQDAGREVVNPPEAGIAVNPDDSAALVDAMCQLLTPGPRWSQWSAAARRRYDAFFTAEHFQKRLFDQLHRLVAGDCYVKVLDSAAS